MRRFKLSQLMDAETWMNANKGNGIWHLPTAFWEDKKKASDAVRLFCLFP